MSTTNKDIQLIVESQERQLLYGIVKTSVQELVKISGEKLLKEKVERFESNLILLINFLSDNNVPAQSLASFLIILINKILVSKDLSEMANINISNIHKNLEKIINSMSTLHILCQDEDFRIAICKIQAKFITDCVTNMEIPISTLRQQLNLSQSRLSQLVSTPQYEIAKENIKKIQTNIEIMNNGINKVKEFCEQYRVTP